MTNYYENLDVILSQYRLAHLKAYDQGHYVLAAKYLYLLNASHPPDAWLKDMKPFVIRTDDPLMMLSVEEKARNYCDHWAPLLEIAMAEFRDENQEAYNRL